MTWEISLNLDLDQEDVGTVSATWIDPNTALGIFTYSKRLKANTVEGNKFVAEVIVARDAWQIKQQTNINGAAWALNKINIADPKAGV